MTNDTCKVCNVKTNRNNKGTTCEFCGIHVHVACINGIENDFKQALLKFDQVKWTCTSCKQKFKSLLSENDRLKAENSTLKLENESLRRRFDNLETQFSNFKTEFKSEILQELRNNPSTPPTADQSQSINDQVLACLREERDRDRKRLNLCLRNFPETDSTVSTGNERARVIELFTSRLGVNGSDLNSGIMNVKRVGTRNDDRPRIIIIECSNIDLRRKLLQNSFKLKDVPPTNDKKVFLTPDMTKKQLEEDRILRDELWSRRNRGENVFIRRGVVVLRQGPANDRPPQPLA